MEAKDIIPLWQPIGFSTNLIAQRIAEKLGEKSSHTGTLDPMAEGVVIVLLGKERVKKKEFARWKKEYIFEITFGISTDTLDSMGLVVGFDFREISDKEISKIGKNFLGLYKQKIPIYSTKKIKGKHLHEYARSGKTIKRPVKKGEIFSLTLVKYSEISSEKHIKAQLDKINKVRGDFRQKEIANNWKNILKSGKLPKNLQTAQFKVETSGGIYVRSLAEDIANELQTYGFCSKIIRTKNGVYAEKDCSKLPQIFSKQELDSNYLATNYKTKLIK